MNELAGSFDLKTLPVWAFVAIVMLEKIINYGKYMAKYANRKVSGRDDSATLSQFLDWIKTNLSSKLIGLIDQLVSVKESQSVNNKTTDRTHDKVGEILAGQKGMNKDIEFFIEVGHNKLEKEISSKIEVWKIELSKEFKKIDDKLLTLQCVNK